MIDNARSSIKLPKERLLLFRALSGEALAHALVGYVAMAEQAKNLKAANRKSLMEERTG